MHKNPTGCHGDSNPEPLTYYVTDLTSQLQLAHDNNGSISII